MMKFMNHLEIVSMNMESAVEVAVFSLGQTAAKIDRIEDAGPADPSRYKDGARVFHVYMKDKP